jgi:hypothetical protein
MTTRDDIIEGIRTNDARLEWLRAGLIANADEPLLEGEWRVRDALAHLAARANGIDRVLQRFRAFEAGTPVTPPANIDEINAGQVEERRDAGVDDLLAEIRHGHAAALEALNHVDDETLAKEMPIVFRPGDASVAELIMRGGPNHEEGHLDAIEEALEAAAREDDEDED